MTCFLRKIFTCIYVYSNLKYVIVNSLCRGAERTFGPWGKKFVWALWSVVPQKHMISKKKDHSVRRCSNFGLKSSDEQKKGHSLRRCSNFGSTSSDEPHKVIASADVRISARNQKITSSRPQAVVCADEFCILNLTIQNPGSPCVPGPPDSDSLLPPPLGGPEPM